MASCGRIWFAGDGAFAPEAWVGSAIQPYPFFSIRADSRDSRASPTYSHSSGLPWLQLKAGRQGISHGGAVAQRGNEHCPNLALLPMILLFFSSAGGQSHIFTYFRASAVVYPLLGSWRLAGGFGLRETAHSRLNLGSARRSNPTHVFRFAWICVIRGQNFPFPD